MICVAARSLPPPRERQKIETQPLDPLLAYSSLIDSDIGHDPWQPVGWDGLELEPLDDDEHGVRISGKQCFFVGTP